MALVWILGGRIDDWMTGITGRQMDWNMLENAIDDSRSTKLCNSLEQHVVDVFDSGWDTKWHINCLVASTCPKRYHCSEYEPQIGQLHVLGATVPRTVGLSMSRIHTRLQEAESSLMNKSDFSKYDERGILYTNNIQQMMTIFIITHTCTQTIYLEVLPDETS